MAVKSKEWKRRITAACKKAGTYQPQFVNAIDTLAQILEDRDGAREQFVEAGSQPVVEENGRLRKNPMLVMTNELNTTALQYWRDLGLTPAGFKRLGEALTKPEKKESLESILSNLGV